MKKLLIIIILFCCAAITNAQDTINLPRETAETALKALKLVPEYETKIKELETLVGQLKANQQTPCSVSVKANADNLIFWHQNLEKALPENRKEVSKTLKQIRKQAKQAIEAQCNIQQGKRWFQYLQDYLPIALIYLARK